ncbi:MAG: DUF4011 domain-containing protein [Ruminococcus sp.]|nr:DUF4011 domain-containing protein [Ruminococcus sp.]
MENLVTFGGNMSTQINFAMQQNYVPVFRSVVLTNTTDAVLSGVRLRAAFEPEFARDFESGAFDLAPGVPVEISPVDISLDVEFLFGLTEKLAGYVRLEAVRTRADGSEEVIARELRTVELLAYDQWTGTELMPETAAAFIMPNHPAVQNLTARAGEFLQKWTKDPSFTAYALRNPNIVRQQMGAVYGALQAENIAALPVSGSFEQCQRIRTHDSVLENRSGGALDIAALYCACLENVGLNPLIAVLQDRVLAGCWLEEETFADSIEYDMSAVTKRMAQGINAIGLVDCTDLCAGRSVDFDTAARHAADLMKDPSQFILALDVARARSGGIRPMPARVLQNGAYVRADYGERKKRDLTAAPEELIITDYNAGAEQREVTKQVMWERKLLDLSLRNSLLNFRPTVNNVQLMLGSSDDALGSLEDEMARDEVFKVMPMPSDMTLSAGDSKIYETENCRELINDIADSEFKNRRLRTFMKESDLEKTMTKLYRLAKVSMEENGANTIYMALGFLKWFETDKSEKPRYAPLILVPVDIIRKVQDKSYSIKIRDEDTQVNVTLLEMLRQFFGIDIKGLDPVPLDESGVDLALIFNIIRKGVMAKSRWDVEDYVFVGQFSFNRFIMWNDIRNRSEELEKNKVVAGLISGKFDWEEETAPMSPLDLDEKIHPAEIAVPVQADSSQLAAVVASGEGKSFVLHGPPGTGKSQTITNMIANALYHGKSVLFVAEKMAALSVVEKRLDKIGLGPFCLELHSNKAQKRAVLNQLDDTLNVGRLKAPEDYRAEADRLHELRKELNSTMEELHKKRSSGFSAYEAAVEYEKNRAFEGMLDFTGAQVRGMDENSLRTWRETLESLVNLGGQFGDISSASLNICRLTECGPDTRDRMKNDLEKLDGSLSQLEQAQGELSQLVGGGELSFKELSDLSDVLGKAAGGSGFIIGHVLEDGGWEVSKPAAMGALKALEDLQKCRQELSEVFEDSVFGYDAQKAQTEWKTVQGKWFLPKSIGSKRLVKELNVYAKAPGAVTKENISDYHTKLIDAARLRTETENGQAAAAGVFGPMWTGESSDVGLLRTSLEKSESIRKLISGSSLEESRRKALRERLGREGSGEGLKALAEKAALSGEALRTADGLGSAYKTDTERLTAGTVEDIRRRTAAIEEELPRLRDWTVIASVFEKLDSAGLDNVTKALTEGTVGCGELLGAFDCGIAKAVLSEAISGSKALSGFSGMLYDDAVRKLKESQERFRELTKRELAAKLSANVPAAGESAKSSELGILQRAIKSGVRMMPIRKLFEDIPNLLRRMCPVMLMSPISVAQYIDPSQPKFDLVIFDEASQLPTCEAVGAIARGENVIVVGDPKQMPPTSFFTANTTDDENYEKEDLESVLDDCLALSMPQQHLLWHYRSKHESLIAYSNSKYYENKLYTFPSPDDQISEVSWVHVEGYYDKGSTKTNKAEAKAIVEEIARRLRDKELRKQSIGVVTFSLPQQNLVDDMLSDKFREEPELESIANEMYEPILIKNLENVQGDERDVIFFSIGYGPDKEGKVSMNFGPLNRDGGWRRLNVAISRARCKMVVYSVITPDQIDLSRTRSEGVEGLKGFLDFAAKGRSALPVRPGTVKAGSGFEKIVAAELTSRGYKADTSVGCSDYKVDVAVADPEKPETYILGISCCAEESFRNSTAYDRTVSQAGVLAGLGWNTSVVYILDWLDNKEKCIEKLEADIRAAIGKKSAPAEVRGTQEKPGDFLSTMERLEESSIEDMCAEYVPFKIAAAGSAQDFTQTNKGKIIKCINDCLAAEAPVSRKSLEKKIFACFGITRSGPVMKKTFESALADADCKSVTVGTYEFLWPKSADPESYSLCRTKCAPADKRTMDEIAPEEIAVGVEMIMSRQISLTRDDLIRETARLFGHTRVSETVETAVSLGIRCLRQRNKIEFTGDGRVNYLA